MSALSVKMSQIYNKNVHGDVFMQLLRHISITMLLLILTACGGGDGNLSNENTPTDPEPDNSSISIEVALSSDTLNNQSPITVTATVMDGSKVVAGKLVSFAISDEELANANPENGASTTNAEGVATITLIVGTKSGGGTITASVDDDGSKVESIAVGFNSAGDGSDSEGPNVDVLSLFANTQQLASSGAQEIELTAIVKDMNNNLVEGATVSFATDSGQIEVTKAVTEKDGQASALLRTLDEPSNRIIEVTANSDGKSDLVNVEVLGTTIQLTGSSSLAIDDDNTFVVKVLNSDGKGIADTEVALSTSGSNLTLPSSIITSATGQAEFTVVGTVGGSDAITAQALGATATQNVTVQTDSFLFTSFKNKNGTTVITGGTTTLPDVVLSDTATITLEWLRSGSPVADGTKVVFTTTRGTLSAMEATTVDGKVSVNVTSNNAGKASVSFTGTDDAIELNNQLEFEFIAETVETIVAQASPDSIGPNQQTSVISVVVKDANGNLVKDKIIDFSLEDTTNGVISPAFAITNSNGAASTEYTSNTVSAKDGVVITATVREDSSKTATVALTVADRELFISLGTGNEIIEFDSESYNKKYSIFVTDVDSTPQEGVELKVSAIPHNYKKGQWVKVYEDGNFLQWAAAVSTVCANEDINKDGILDLGEDINGDGILTPGNIVAAAGDLVTDENGQAIIDILYPQSYAQWSDIDLIVTATVTGTESQEQTLFTLPVNSSDVNQEDVNPPVQGVGLNSPFGSSASCSNTD